MTRISLYPSLDLSIESKSIGTIFIWAMGTIETKHACIIFVDDLGYFC